jgi:hypothetical protein
MGTSKLRKNLMFVRQEIYVRIFFAIPVKNQPSSWYPLPILERSASAAALPLSLLPHFSDRILCLPRAAIAACFHRPLP